jgi:hypothetical protein
MAAYTYRSTTVANAILDTDIFPKASWSVANDLGALDYTNTDTTIDGVAVC